MQDQQRPVPTMVANEGPPSASLPGGTDAGTSSSGFRLGNRPPLTGIRALALFTVLAYHSNFKTFPGSWVALQVFFVLSGFLITAMLAGEGRRNGRVDLKQFYTRRAARLLPPLLLAIALLAVYAYFVHVADASARVWGDSSAAFFYYADYRQALGHAPFFGYFAQSWSLSVEEQFYVVWSVLMVAAVAWHRRRLAYGFAIAGIALSVADRLWLTIGPHHFDNAVFTRVYYAFDSRADALFLGCLLGLLAADGRFSRWPRWSVRSLGAAALVSLAFLSWVLLDAPLFTETLALWWLPATALASGVIIVYLVMCPAGIGAKFAGLGLFVFIGNLSYTIYIIHFPVYLALEPGASGTHWTYWPTELVRLAIIFAIAIASWYAIERPLARWRARSAAR